MATAITPDPFTQALQRIQTLLNQGQLQAAAQALQQAQAQQPQDPRVPLMGMFLAERAGNLAGAIQAGQRAVKLNPEWFVAHSELALRLARQGKTAEAMTHARRAVQLAPQEFQVLLYAAAVAEMCNDSAQTAEWLQAALAQQPGHEGVRFNLGLHLQRLERWDEAEAELKKLLDTPTGRPRACEGLLAGALQRNDEAQARHWAEQWLAAQPHNEEARYWHAVTHGQTPATQPRTVVRGLFDGMAQDFDTHLVRELNYRLPEKVAGQLLTLHPDKRFNLLDLGCGTGLLGLYLGPIEGFMIGVDLSREMIAQASRHNLYARFHTVNILDALRETPSDHYEVIACLDALIYVGDLTPVIPNALRILKPGGHFVFSCETANEDEADLVLRPSKRYAHKRSAVERLCREAGFDEVKVEHLESLRTEGGQPLPGFLVTARKPAAAAA